jgi:phospholipid/cholesterol/gamma-HCH transport system substrate-binding protein
MKNVKRNYIIVGTIVSVLSAALIALVLILAGGGTATVPYLTEYKNVDGLKYGTQITFEGFPVGQVQAIRPRHSNGRVSFVVEMAIDETWPIPKGSIANVTSSGVLAAKSIDIHAGTATDVLPPGAKLEGRMGAGLFSAVNSIASEVDDISENGIKPLLATLNTETTQLAHILRQDSAEVLGNLVILTNAWKTDGIDALHSLKQTADILATDVPQITRAARTAMENLDQDVLSQQNRTRIASAIANAHTSAEALNTLLHNLQKTNAALENLVQAGAPQLQASLADLKFTASQLATRIDTILHNVEGASRNINEFSREIRYNPSRLLGGDAPQDIGQ